MDTLVRAATKKRPGKARAEDAIGKGFRYLESIQSKDGAWKGETGLTNVALR